MLEQKIIITETKGRRLTALFENNKVVELHYSSDKTKPYRLGEIYVGKVKKILPNRAGAFVEIGNHMECYYPLEEKCTPVFTAKYGKNALVAGDELLVQIHTEALKTKPENMPSSPLAIIRLAFPISLKKQKKRNCLHGGKKHRFPFQVNSELFSAPTQERLPKNRF